YHSNDEFLINGYRESFGAIVGRFERSYSSYNNKSRYFRMLAMNNIIDLSDDSDGSHLAQINSAAQTNVKDMLCTSHTTSKEPNTGGETFEISSQKLETMFYDKYIYTEGSCSEADYIVKLYGPIMENIFRGSGCRLLWGDTKSPFVKRKQTMHD
ncbi:hypothetical protein INT48_006766, partial [Thamnidium elegans]